MSRILIGAIGALLAVVPTAAKADDTWAMQRKVLYLYPNAGGFTFKLDGAQLNIGSTCEANRMVLPISAPNYEAIVSSLVLAFSSGYIVDVAYESSTTSGCETVINRVVVYRRS